MRVAPFTGEIAVDFDNNSSIVAKPAKKDSDDFLSFSTLPTSFSAYFKRFLGGPNPAPPYALPPLRVLITAFVGAFSALLVLGSLDTYVFIERADMRGVLNSMGASAVLLYAVPDSPLSHPRNVVLGNLIGAIVGKALAFTWHAAWGPRLAWVSGALACATSIVLMQLTNTVHPPAGATAFIFASTMDPLINNFTPRSWLAVLYPAVGGFFLMVVVALIVDNVASQVWSGGWCVVFFFAKLINLPLLVSKNSMGLVIGTISLWF